MDRKINLNKKEWTNRHLTLKIVLIYSIFALSCTVFYKIVLLKLDIDINLKNQLELVRAPLFIVLTAFVLYVLLREWETRTNKKYDELKRLYDLLEEGNERLKRAFDATKEGYWEHDLITDKLVHSPSMYTMFGLEDLSMQNDFSWWSERLIREDCEKIMDILDKCRRGEIESYDFIFKIKPFDEKIFYVRTRGKVIKDNQNKAVKMYGTHSDVTKIKEYELELSELNATLRERVEKESAKVIEKERLLIRQSKMATMGEMIGVIAHQWRQPLNSLAIIIQDVEQAYKYGELNDEYLAKFKHNSINIIRNMSNTIDDFRKFFSPNKKAEEFFIEDAIDETLKIIEPQLKNYGIDIVFNNNSGIKHKYAGFKNELKQALLNIVSNAKDALFERKPQNRFIKIAVSAASDNMVKISIEDSAGGVPENIIGKIFDPYFTTKSDDKGTGIGLYMTKQIIEESFKGIISISNSDNGARFVVEFPLYG